MNRLYKEEGSKQDIYILADEVAEEVGYGEVLNEHAGECVSMELLAEGSRAELLAIVEEQRDKEQELFSDVRVADDENIFAEVFSDGTTTWWIADTEENLRIGWFDYLMD